MHCAAKPVGYWAFELCVNQNATQYPYRAHGGAPSRHQSDKKRVSLGTYARTVRGVAGGEGEGGGGGGGGGAAVLVQYYEGGTKCDGTKLRRMARVEYVCGPTLQLLQA